MDEIGKHLGIKPVIEYAEIVGEEVPSKSVVKAENATSESERDYKYARQNFIDIIEKGADALENLMDVALQSQHPRRAQAMHRSGRCRPDSRSLCHCAFRRDASFTQSLAAQIPCGIRGAQSSWSLPHCW